MEQRPIKAICKITGKTLDKEVFETKKEECLCVECSPIPGQIDTMDRPIRFTNCRRKMVKNFGYKNYILSHTTNEEFFFLKKYGKGVKSLVVHSFLEIT